MQNRKQQLLNVLIKLPDPSEDLESFDLFVEKFASYGITENDTQSLIEIVTDKDLFENGTQQEFFAINYAVYALGALKATSAINELCTQLHRCDIDGDDWSECFEKVFVLMGESAIEPLIAKLGEVSLRVVFPLVIGLAELANQFPAHRQAVLVAFDQLLERFNNEPIFEQTLFEGFTPLLMGWLDMKAVEKIDVIRELYHQNKFDIQYAGDLANIEYELGYSLIPPKKTARHQLADLLLQPKKVGRNDPCICGSGKKYKKCCLQ